MFGVKCKQCNNMFTSDFVSIVDRLCVYCKYNTNEFYMNGDLVIKQEAININKMFENITKEENKKYGRYRCL